MHYQNMTYEALQGEKLPPLHVLICPDQPDWAFDNITNNIVRHKGRNRVSKLYMRDIIGNESRLLETIFLKRIDLCHIFWREDLFRLLTPATLSNAAQRMGLDSDIMARAINSCAFTTSVYDHLFIDADEIRQRVTAFALIDGYTVSSEKLRDIYATQPEIPVPDAVIPDGVDINHFCPRPIAQAKNGPFAIGWVGNSAWGQRTGVPDVKGFGRLFNPLMAELLDRGHNVEAKVADPQIKRIDFKDMPDFYRQLDVFVCTSASEGTPNPVLEAMACGIPVVSTDVGIVPEVFGDQQKRFVMTRPCPGDFADAIAELKADAELRTALGKENRRRALNWSWEQTTKSWWPFWQRIIRRTMDPRNAVRREICLRTLAHIM